jgi:mRNA interferase MazF
MSVKRGDIYWVDWNPSRGSEQKGIRPALVIQNDIGNDKSATTIVASCTTAPNKPYPFIVNFTSADSGLDKDGSVDLASIITIDKTRLLNKLGQLSQSKMKEVDRALIISLDISG